MRDVGLISYGLGAALFAVLTLLLLTAWRGRLQGGLLVTACVVSVVWAGALGLNAHEGRLPFEAIAVLELLRAGAWYAFVLKVLGYAKREQPGTGTSRRFGAVPILIMALPVILLAIVLGAPHVASDLVAGRAIFQVSLFGFVVLAIVGLALIEQLYRNTRMEHRWAIKYLCLGLGGLFAYDFFLYSHAMLFRNIHPDLWHARGVVNAFAVPLFAVAAARNPQWSLEIFVSRHIVFHTVAVLGAGVYLIVMAGAGYYIRTYGGTWGGVAQVVFLSGAVLLLLLMMFSAQIRSRAKIFLSKHFFKNKYDYREEWLRFTHTLSTSEPDVELKENIVRAIAEIVESPGGVMWIDDGTSGYYPVSSWNCARPESGYEPADSSLVRFLRAKGWVIYLDELATEPENYAGLELPTWMDGFARPWLILPLMQRDELLGFIVVSRSSSVNRHLSWEDGDLLRTVGRQAASYLALLKANEALAESRQFDAFNRLSSFVVHDLKNLVAQLSLVSSNAKKHLHSPGFLEDALGTLDNATAKMNRMLAQLRKGRLEDSATELVNLKPVLHKVMKARAADRPAPALRCFDETVIIETEPHRLADIIDHLVQNAQEATPDDGKIEVRLRRDDNWAIVEIEDTGCGMSPEFVSERLFRPFDTTKGNAGMGIGVYESREFVTSHGGRVTVSSNEGRGTTFVIRLPLGDGGAPAIEEDTHMEAAS